MRPVAALVALSLLLPVVASAAKPPRRPAVPMAAARAPLADSAAVLALLAGVQNAACPLAGVATGGQPDSARVAALAKAGFTTLLDLRAADEPRGFEEAAIARALGVRYVTIPITPSTLADSTFDAFRAAMTPALAAGAAPGESSGVFVHCASGNRVGAAMIPWLVLDRGWDLERAVAAAKAGGLHSAELEAKARAYVARKRDAR